MAIWKAEKTSSLVPKNPVLVAGLPGIGNVGKIAADFLVDELHPEKIYTFFSHSMPHSVFVNEDNLVDLPKLEMHLFRGKENDVLILTGDIQPLNEESCYDFCETVLDLFQEMKGKEIITLGGIGLREVPPVPKVYATGNSKKIISRYMKGTGINNNVFGLVGPIMGVAGLLIGLAGKRDIEAISLLAETLGHPMYLGLTGAKEILKVLDTKLVLKLDFKNLDKEIKNIEEQLKKGDSPAAVSPEKVKYARKVQKYKEMNYIG